VDDLSNPREASSVRTTADNHPSAERDEQMTLTLRSVVAAFGGAAKAKLANVAASGEPEEQLRTPLETLVLDMVELCGIRRAAVTCVGEEIVNEACGAFRRLNAPYAAGRTTSTSVFSTSFVRRIS